MEHIQSTCLILFTILFTSCGIGLDLPKHDPRFDSIRSQFRNDAALFGRYSDPSDVSIAFGDPRKEYELLGVINVSKDPGRADAICLEIPEDNNEFLKIFYKSTYGKYSGHKLVVIDRSYENRTPEQIEAIVYHELGHCVLDLPHEEDQLIMAPESPPISLGAFRYFYLKEMFTGDNQFPGNLKHMKAEDLRRYNKFELIYHVDYRAINGVIKNTLYFDSESESYFLMIDEKIEESMPVKGMDII